MLFVSFTLSSILEDFDRELEHTDSKLRTLTKRVELAIKKTSGKSLE